MKMLTTIHSFNMISFLVFIFIIFIGHFKCDADVFDESACTSKSLYSDDFFDVLGDKSNECFNVINVKRILECDRLNDNEGFINDDNRMLICQLKCVGYERMCLLFDGKNLNEDRFDLNIDFEDLFTSSKDYVTEVFENYDPNVGFDEGDLFRDVEIETFMKFAWKTWPLLTTLVPLLLNQYAYYNFKGYLVGMFFMLGFYAMASFTYIEAFYNMFMWILCLVTEAGRNPLREFTLSYSLLLTGLFFCFVVKGWAKFFSGFAIFLIYGFYTYVTFVKKTNALRGTGVAMFIAHLILMYEQLKRLDDFLHMDAFSFTVVRAIVNAVLPNERSGYLVYNVINIAYTMVKYVAPSYKVSCWIVFIIIQLFCFVAIRCLFGVYVINALRFKADIHSYFTGGLLYSSGIFDGIKYIYAVILGEESVSSRRMAYSAVSLLMACFEAYCAREFFILRIFIFASDKVLWSSVYSNAPKYLDMNIDMKRMAYPQDCKSVWVSMKRISEITKHVKRLNVTIGNKNFKGIGFANKHTESGRASVLTIHHVGDCSEVVMDGVVYLRPDVRVMSGADDPIVSIELSPYDGDYCKDINLLTSDEVHNIKQVVITSLADEEDEPMMVFSNEFSIDPKGDLRIFSCLQEGDSGGPVFAAMKDGSVRYAGAVSRTSDIRSKGHKFAFVTTPSGVCHDTDSEGGSPDRVAVNFNRQRNRGRLRNDSNLTNLCNAQHKLMEAVGQFAHWVVDVSSEAGYRWVDDVESGGKCEYIEERLPDDYDEHKRRYDKKRKRKSNLGRQHLTRVKDLADVVFGGDPNAYDSFMRMVHAGHEFNYVSGTIVYFSNGVMMVDDNPDPNEYSIPDRSVPD